MSGNDLHIRLFPVLWPLLTGLGCFSLTLGEAETFTEVKKITYKVCIIRSDETEQVSVTRCNTFFFVKLVVSGCFVVLDVNTANNLEQ